MGFSEGETVGVTDGGLEGGSVGTMDGSAVGASDGATDSVKVKRIEGANEGEPGGSIDFVGMGGRLRVTPTETQ